MLADEGGTQRGDGRPDPSSAVDAGSYIRQLRLLKVWAGNPSLDQLRRATGVPRSTLADALSPRRGRLPSLDLVMRYVQASGWPAGAMGEWAAAWRRISAAAEPSGDADGGMRVSVVPRQLPLAARHFVGRDNELKALDELAASAPGPATVVIGVISGTAGVGKTALAVRWAHKVADQFPDGQLYVNLRGYHQGPPMRAIEAFAHLLHALGIPPDQVPVESEQAAGLYRSLLAGRRALVLLDNAADADQVRPLLPGTSGCLVLVTSRDQLSGLAAREGAYRFTLDRLPEPEATNLLRGLLGERVDAEPDAAAVLVDRCVGLPLALRIAAAHLTGHPGHRLASYVERLDSGDRLAALQIDGDPQTAVRAAVDLSYHRLAPDTRRLFRLLGLMPGPDVTAETAAALAGSSARHAGRLLDRLAGAHLLESHSPGRFAFHDLLRAYAGERTHAEDGERDRRAAADRLHHHYLHRADAAAQRLYPGMVRLPPAAGDGPPPEDAFADRETALAWLDSERANLVATVIHTAGHGPRSVAWRLADGLRGYLWLRVYAVDWLAVASAGSAAAEADHHPAAQAAAQLSLGLLHWRLDQYPQAIEHSTRALDLAKRASWIEGESAALGNLGALHLRSGQLEQSAMFQTEALALEREAGWIDGIATSHASLGAVYTELGRLEQAADHYIQALAMSEQAGNLGCQMTSLVNLGLTQHALGRLTEAVGTLTRGLGLSREMGDRGEEARALLNLAAARCDAGSHGEAAELAETAIALSRELGSRWIEADARNTLGTVEHRRDRHQRAIDQHRQALRLAQHTGNRHTEIDAYLGLVASRCALGQFEPALTHAREALTHACAAGYRLREGQARTALATVHLAQGDLKQAVAEAERALAIHPATGHRLGEARTHLLLGDAVLRTGDIERARQHRQRAIDLFDEIGIPEADPARAAL